MYSRVYQQIKTIIYDFHGAQKFIDETVMQLYADFFLQYTMDIKSCENDSELTNFVSNEKNKLDSQILDNFSNNLSDDVLLYIYIG